MSAKAYCGSDWEAKTFSELCPGGQVRVVLHLVLIPVIMVANTIVIVTVLLLKKLHTSHNYFIFAIAAADLSIAVVICPLYLLNAFPETVDVLGSDKNTCVDVYLIRIALEVVSFDYIVLMCVDRFLHMCKPIWYLNHESKRNTIILILSVLAFRAGQLTWFVYVNHFDGEAQTDNQRSRNWTTDDCLLFDIYQARPTFLVWASLFLFNIEVLVSFVSCVAVTTTAVSWYSRRRLSIEAHHQYAQAKRNAMFISSLMFLHLWLWFPTVLNEISYFATGDEMFTNTQLIVFNDVKEMFRYVNSGLNAVVYAATRPVYRHSFKFLLTYPPWRWPYLPKYHCIWEIDNWRFNHPPWKSSSSSSTSSSGSSSSSSSSSLSLPGIRDSFNPFRTSPLDEHNNTLIDADLLPELTYYEPKDSYSSLNDSKSDKGGNPTAQQLSQLPYYINSLLFNDI